MLAGSSSFMSHKRRRSIALPVHSLVQVQADLAQWRGVRVHLTSKSDTSGKHLLGLVAIVENRNLLARPRLLPNRYVIGARRGTASASGTRPAPPSSSKLAKTIRNERCFLFVSARSPMGISDFGLAVETSHPKERGRYPNPAWFRRRTPVGTKLTSL